jgi:transposase-like protein
MLIADRDAAVMNDQAIELITERVVEALRTDLDAIVAELSTPGAPEQLTVGQVAQRLGVTRSTVYAHWREWGGYKLGRGSRATIRFDTKALPAAPARPAPVVRRTLTGESSTKRSRRRTGRRDLLVDAPRFAHPLDGLA